MRSRKIGQKVVIDSDKIAGPLPELEWTITWTDFETAFASAKAAKVDLAEFYDAVEATNVVLAELDVTHNALLGEKNALVELETDPNMEV